ncbi:hypothetical protein EFA69_17020 [Rufibacter immobilis]|uniref:Uncharacterized protein n=1 Tax=Rufibacter immobilis TaxID=1348778 RepID=A0A3M9MRG5_9BACT|nr:hypothetical protein EFA69_17020 [Rufibacter immobilis]
MFSGMATQAQTLATPAAKEQSSATAKPQDAKLGAKINALIKKQAPAPATAQAKPATPATPAAAAASSSEDTAAPKTAPITAKESRVDQLITEREQLVLKYDYLKTQSNNFWGKASKEDMRAVIEALKEVLQKDEQIIHAVEQANLETRRNVAKRAAELEAEARKLNTQVLGDKRVVTDNIYDLKSSLTNAQNLIKRRDREIKDLEEQLQSSKDAKFEHDAIAAFFAMLALVLVGYIVRLRNKLTGLRQEKHVKA